MNLHDIWSIAGAILASVGGAGVIICATAGYISNRIANRLDAKYAHRLNKELEKYKLTLDQRRHVTKAQFDKEFEIYHQLSEAFFSMIVKLSSFTYRSFDSIDTEKMNQDLSIDEMKKMIQLTCNAQNSLYINAAFIPKDIYELYNSVMEKANGLFWRYYKHAEEFRLGKRQYSDIVSEEDKAIEEVIEGEFHFVNSKLRDYLSSLSIIE